ncbi:MAG TPA: response regulator [Chitinophagaceae bacterium]|nr:response regulator [Chitinophagaceae bacterium]
MKAAAHKKTVLIIDDEEELCMLMELVLEREHFIAQSIHMLSEALTIIQRMKPDYIFLDNHLPDGKGIDFIRKMIDTYPGAKIVMMTAHNEKQLNEKALHEGASYFLHKPFNRNNIENIINSL